MSMWPWLLGLGLLAALKKRGDAMTLPSAPRPPVFETDWKGWIFPVPIWQKRVPTVTQEWKPGKDPGFGNSSGKNTNHLGVDIMFRKLAADPQGPVKHDASHNFIAPPGTPILAAGPGKIWSTGQTGYGRNILIDHGKVGTVPGVLSWYQHLDSFSRDWVKGDVVKAGDLLGFMGYAPGGDGEGLRHLHFELRFPVAATDPDSWRQDPQPYMRQWLRVERP